MNLLPVYINENDGIKQMAQELASNSGRSVSFIAREAIKLLYDKVQSGEIDLSVSKSTTIKDQLPEAA